MTCSSMMRDVKRTQQLSCPLGYLPVSLAGVLEAEQQQRWQEQVSSTAAHKNAIAERCESNASMASMRSQCKRWLNAIMRCMRSCQCAVAQNKEPGALPGEEDHIKYYHGQPGIANMLKGSAVCTRQEFVPCPSCTMNQFQNDRYRLATATNTDTSGDATTIYFALKNFCADGATFEQGMVNYGTLIFVILAILVLNAYQRKQEILFDEDELTAQDYSVVIANPPPDATDPEEWKGFFADKFDAHVTVCVSKSLLS
mmetsp:Transcript_35507/g.71980  ORF Transcript_35507/g.71980 Transcript_35507/m.71980 type:complete len:256 (-) Transcript_35507:3885-4652(-)